MDITKYISHNKIALRVTPNASQTKLIEDNGKLKLYVKSIPEDNKANREVINFFKKEFNLKVLIDKGEKSREKIVKIM